MTAITELERQYPAVGNTELWQLLKRKVSKENLSVGFLEAVGKVCIHGITLSKDIIRFFPTFTLHDETHIVNVCNWMVRLLGEKKSKLSVHEMALLVMAACCHDIGMSVSVDQEKDLAANPESLEWKKYFRNHYSDDEEFSKSKIISKQMMRNYVRLNHHKLIGENLKVVEWPELLLKNGISCTILIRLCQSHGQALEQIDCPKGMPYDLRLCVVLLRIADILDFDSSRAPMSLFKQLGLESPGDFEARISQTEWMKNRAGVFGEIKDGIIPFTASFTSLQLEYEVRSHLEWVHQELTSSCEYLTKYTGNWSDLKLPREISTDSIERNGYQFGKFCMTLDQDQVLTLFAGENLYGDPSVFVRELLQNAFDAVLLRSVLDPHFTEKDGKVTIRSWTDDEGNDWFRIEDNGVGMDEDIITHFFLKIGRSYYTSEAFKAEKRHYAPETDYIPISRFGIGILSCFMCDPENTLLEVSTRRYSQDLNQINPAVRMNITGLHGYYYLVREDVQSEYDTLFKRMHHPADMDVGYHVGTGTTICVQVNIGNMGNYCSFKEILDKYVRFPKILVEYYGSEGHIVYPTQQELMSAVHALDPDMKHTVKTYSHPIPDKQYAELKHALPNVIWKEPPSISLQYVPLDRFSSTGNISGVLVNRYTRESAEVVPLICKDEQIPCLIQCRSEDDVFSKEISLRYSIVCEMEIEKRQKLDKFKQHLVKGYEKEYVIKLSYKDLLLQMSPDEAAVFQFILVGELSLGAKIAYRGVLIGDVSIWYPGLEYCAAELLLDGTARPEVSLARDSINSMPVEVRCNLAIMAKSLALDLDNTLGGRVSAKNFSDLTEQKLQELLEKNPYWEKRLRYVEKEKRIFFFPDCDRSNPVCMNISGTLTSYWEIIQKFEKREILGISTFVVDYLYNWIWVAAVKKYTNIYDGAPDTSKFPVILFCMRPIPDGPFGWVRFDNELNYYNSCHRFSRWLIQQQDALQVQTPSIYNRLIKTLILGKSKEEVMESVNDILTQLKRLKGNPYDVSDILFLKDSDFL